MLHLLLCQGCCPVSHCILFLQVWNHQDPLSWRPQQTSVSHPNPLHCLWYSLHSMSTTSTEDDQSSPAGRKHVCSSTLQLGPRKKVCVTVPSIWFTDHKPTPHRRTIQDPLMHHGCHFGRAIHAFFNVQMLITNGLQAMCDNTPVDKSLTAVCIF